MNWRKWAIASLAVLASFDASSANTLICVEDVAGGIKFVDGAWKGVSFKTGQSQFMVSSQPSDPLNYVVKKIGDDTVLFSCSRLKFTSGLSEQLVCGGLGYGMVINFKQLRYVEVYTLGYIDDDRSGQNTPSVTGGKCSTISP